MLKPEQNNLLAHLAQFGVAGYDACLRVLDVNRTNNRVALSYVFRPLVRLGYTSKRRDGLYGLLKSGHDLVPKVKSLIAVGGDETGRKRAATISGIAALLLQHGIVSAAVPPNHNTPVFIPAPCWRKIRPGLLSTVRFAGTLLMGDHRLAVYDIEDGEMDWQLYAERSLFFHDYGERETRANGMLFVCAEGKRLEIAERIIRRTMWERKRLIENTSSFESDKRRSVAHAPIRLHKSYARVFLAEPSTLGTCLYGMIHETYIIDWLAKEVGGENITDKIWDGDVESKTTRYYVIPHTDLLKYVHIFASVKMGVEMGDSYGGALKECLVVADIDAKLMELYSFMKGVEHIALDTSGWDDPSHSA